jgi:hypothetical protein
VPSSEEDKSLLEMVEEEDISSVILTTHKYKANYKLDVQHQKIQQYEPLTTCQSRTKNIYILAFNLGQTMPIYIEDWLLKLR